MATRSPGWVTHCRHRLSASMAPLVITSSSSGSITPLTIYRRAICRRRLGLPSVMSAITACGCISRRLCAMERARRGRGNRSGLGKAEPKATVFQQVIGLEHRGRTDPIGAAGVAHRRHLLAGGEHAAADQFGNLVGEFLVAFHRIRRCAEYSNALYGELPRHATVSARAGR